MEPKAAGLIIFGTIIFMTIIFVTVIVAASRKERADDDRAKNRIFEKYPVCGRYGKYKVVIHDNQIGAKYVSLFIRKRKVYEGRERRYEDAYHVYNDPIELTKKHVKAYEAQLDEHFAEESRRMAWDGDVYEDDDAVDISEENEKEAVE